MKPGFFFFFAFFCLTYDVFCKQINGMGCVSEMDLVEVVLPVCYARWAEQIRSRPSTVCVCVRVCAQAAVFLFIYLRAFTISGGESAPCIWFWSWWSQSPHPWFVMIHGLVLCRRAANGGTGFIQVQTGCESHLLAKQIFLSRNFKMFTFESECKRSSWQLLIERHGRLSGSASAAFKGPR